MIAFKTPHSKPFWAFLFVFSFPLFLSATIRLPSFFSDNMVLQRQTQASIWGWGNPGAVVIINTSWNKQKYTATATAEGKWYIKVATPAAGGPFSITISDGKPVVLKNVYIGDVWLCSGQSNMEMPMKGFRDQPILNSNEAIMDAENELLRVYTVPRAVERSTKDTTKSSAWKTATPESISNFSATGYYFGRILQQKLKIPIALINVSYGGSPAEAFMSAESLKAFAEIPVPAADGTEKLSNKNATTLYNGMIHPLAGYTIKGCIWYQGESNYDRPDQYEKLFTDMVALWRKEWNQGVFPFYFAQIAPFNYKSITDGPITDKMNSAYIRDAQRKSLAYIPNSAMIVLMEKGEEFNIHPADKETVGKRFALAALTETYQQKGFAGKSPVLDSLLISGSVATIKFTNTPNGLTSFNKPLTQFEIAGADKRFYPAQAVIRNRTIQVSSPQVSNPIAVRYAFSNFIVGELFNTEGLPVSSFRTDNW